MCIKDIKVCVQTVYYTCMVDTTMMMMMMMMMMVAVSRHISRHFKIRGDLEKTMVKAS